jgi:hypothetical protein
MTKPPTNQPTNQQTKSPHDKTTDRPTNQPTNYMVLRPSREATNCAATEEFPNTSWNPKVHYCVHNTPPLVPILSQINPVHTTPFYLSNIHFNINHQPTFVLVVSFLLAFPPISYMQSSFPTIHATCPTHLILLDFIILIILGKEYKSWRSSSCSFLQPPVTSTLFSPNILPSTLFWNTFSLCSSLNIKDQVSHP